LKSGLLVTVAVAWQGSLVSAMPSPSESSWHWPPTTVYPAWQVWHCESVASVQVSALTQFGTAVHARHWS
jgi:hypothetical protein